MPSWKLQKEQLIKKSITQSCLLVGNSFKSTSKKVAKYLVGTRQTREIFKLYELRYLLLKIYPLIHNIFNNPRSNLKLKIKEFQILPNESLNKPLSKFSLKSSSKSLSKEIASWNSSTKTFKNKFKGNFKKNFKNNKKDKSKETLSFVVKRKNVPPQILFASVTPSFSEIISKAAQICNMPVHKNRWLSGSITAAISYPSDKLIWQYLQDSTQKNVFRKAFTQWGSNKENEEKIKEKMEHYKSSRWPSLIVIPDISNNGMILKEARKVGLPVIGLVNSNCLFEIEYPIFAQEETQESVHFFCHFLAILIAKEAVFLQHKRYTLQKTFRQTKKISTTENKEKYKVKYQERDKERKLMPKKKYMFTLEKGVASQKIKKPWEKRFFYQMVIPWKKRIVTRDHLRMEVEKYHPLLSNQKFPNKKFRPKKKYKKVSPSRQKLNLVLNSLVKLSKKKIKKPIEISYRQKFTFKNEKVLFLKKIYNENYYYPRLKMAKDGARKQYSHTLDKKLFYHENKKRFFQKTGSKTFSNNFIFQERQQIYRTLRNFLGVSKLTHQVNIYKKYLPKSFPFETRGYYFRNSLKQWSQHFKWKDYPELIKRWIKLKKSKRRKEKKISRNSYPNKYQNSYPSSKKKYKPHKPATKSSKKIFYERSNKSFYERPYERPTLGRRKTQMTFQDPNKDTNNHAKKHKNYKRREKKTLKTRKTWQNWTKQHSKT